MSSASRGGFRVRYSLPAMLRAPATDDLEGSDLVLDPFLGGVTSMRLGSQSESPD
jgi:hypothetical protein